MSDDKETLIVILRWRERRNAEPGDVVIHGIVANQAELDRRMAKVARANPQYPLRPIGKEPHRMWRIGPDEDAGFFGDAPMFFKALEVAK